MTDRLVSKAKRAAADSSASIWKRITNTMLALNANSDIGCALLEQMHKPQNALLHQKMQAYLLGQVVPIVANLVEEGMEQKIFYTEYPREAAEMVLIYSNEAFDDLVGQSSEDKVRRMQAFIYHAERILGATSGSMQQSMMEIFEGQVERNEIRC